MITFVVKDLSFTSAELFMKRGSESSLYRSSRVVAAMQRLTVTKQQSKDKLKTLTILKERQNLHLCRLRDQMCLHQQ